MGSVSNEFTSQIEALTRQKDNAYAERDMLLSLAAKMAVALGLNVGLGKHDPKDSNWEDDWRNIVYIDLPEGQISFHIHISEVHLFQFLPTYAKEWDGHTNDEKWARVLNSEFQRQPSKSKVLGLKL